MNEKINQVAGLICATKMSYEQIVELLHNLVSTINESPICPHCHKYKKMQGNGIMHQLCECSQNFADKFIHSQKDIDPEIAQIVNDNFWEML